MSDPLAWIEARLEDLARQGLTRQRRTRRSPQSAHSLVLEGCDSESCDSDGCDSDGDGLAIHELINFGGNDYLGVASEDMTAVAADAIAKLGWGAGASPLLGGRSAEHSALESDLARFLECQAALVFPTGFAANVGCLDALTEAGDVIFSDSLNHASIIDGCRLSRARVEVYSHGDVDSLEQKLATASDPGRRMIVTDTLFSMHGDVAPLAELSELAKRYDAMLMVDEAHATGVFGEQGRGLCEAVGVTPDVHVGTLSKALGSHGGFVAGRRPLIDWLFNRARPYFFSTAAPAPTAAVARAALRIVAEQPERRRRVLKLAADLRERLQRTGWSTGQSCSQIVPILVGDGKLAMALSERLMQAGIFAPGIRPPSVPAGNALLRVSLSAAHQDADIDRLVESLGSAQ